jgi:hypothetical protein
LFKADEAAFGKALPDILLNELVGWCGFPWGLLPNPQALFHCFSGGEELPCDEFN